MVPDSYQSSIRKIIVHRLRMSTAQGRVVQVAVHRLGRTPNEARCLFVAGVAVANSEYGEEPPAVPENLIFFNNMGIDNIYSYYQVHSSYSMVS